MRQHWTGAGWILWVWSLIAGSATLAQESVRLNLPIRYLTHEALYVAAGTADGLRVGDAIAVVRDGRIIVKLEVKFVAEHSASCLLDNVSEKIHSADKIVWTIPRAEFLKRTQKAEARAEKPVVAPQPQKASPAPASVPRPAQSRQRLPRNNAVSGQISLQALLQRDNSARQFDFFEPSAYFRLRVDRLAGMPLQFGLRLRSRQNYRTNPVNDQLQRRETINRLYEISLAYAPSQGAVELVAGRMLRNDIRGLGYLDGVTAAYRIGNGLKAGLFWGSPPDLYHSSFQFQERKMGGFVNFKNQFGGNGEFSTTVTGIGWYAQQQLSREYIAVQSDLSVNRQLYISQYVEMDFNRQWRRDLEGSSMSFNDFFVNATYYWRPSISFNAAYDARKNVRTWENHNIADSLFDNSLRRGLHLGAHVQPLPTLRLSLDGGVRTNANSENVYSGSIAVTQSNLWAKGFGISGRMSYYGNSVSRGYYPSADVSWQFFHRLHCSVSGGAYIYSFSQPKRRQTNPWERVRLDFNLTRQLYFSSTFENFHGDSMKFIRAFVDAGVRF